MAIYAKHGGYIGLEPGTTDVYADRPVGDSWEALRITQRGPEGWFDIDFVAANTPLRLDEATHHLVTGDNHDGWGGQWVISADGKTATCADVVLAIEGYVVAAPIHLEVRGNDFVDAHGQRIALTGCDGFMDYRLWLDGGAVALEPFMAESREFGFTVRRVFMQGSKSQNQVLELVPANEPRWRSELRPFVTSCNAHGIVPLLTFCVDNQVVKSDLPALWNAAHAEVAGLKYLASWGNELNKNGGDPNTCPTPPAGVVWSRGSKTQDEFYAPNGAPAAEFHPVRNIEEGRTQMDAVASVFYMQAHGCGMLWLDESYPFDNDTPTHYAYDLWRLYTTYWALTVFHNRQGQRGQLMGPGTRACAAAAQRGARL